jgi:ankyrin repeat protein
MSCIEFVHICKTGDIKTINNIIQNDLVDKSFYEYGLYSACEYNNIEIVKLLIEHGSRINPRIIFTICNNGYIEILQYLINSGKIPNTEYNYCVLQACRGNQYDILKYILDLGYRDGKIFYKGLICIYYESLKPNVFMAKLLIESGSIDIHNNIYDYILNPGRIIPLLENNLSLNYLKDIYGYKELVNDINNFKQKTKNSLTVYLLDPIISIIQSYSLL